MSEILRENTLWTLKYSTFSNQISVGCNAHYTTSFVESMISGVSVNCFANEITVNDRHSIDRNT